MRDGSFHDYRINSVYQLSLEGLGKDLPKWYKDLGSNVSLYLLSFTQVWDLKDRHTYTMVKIEGDDDRVWFINGNAEFGSKPNGGKFAESEYNSLISFDGFERVRNTVNFDSINLSVDFAANEDMDVEKITVDIDGEKLSVPSENITYIGGGKMTYESFF